MTIEDLGEWEVIVVGGGPAGFTAAVAASRAGVRTLLVERYGFLGGMSTAALVGPWMTFHDRKGNQVVKGLPQEIVERLAQEGGTLGHVPDTMGETFSVTPVDPEAVKYVFMKMAVEAGVELLLHSFACEVMIRDRSIKGIKVTGKSGMQLVRGRVVIDATGDADVAALAGVPYEKGRPEDGLCQPVSLIFRMGNVDMAAVEDYMKNHPEDFHHRTNFASIGVEPVVSVSGFFSQWRDAVASGKINIPRERILFFRGVVPGTVTVNTTRVLKVDGTSTVDLTRAEIEARDQVWIVSHFLRDNIPGFERAFLLDSGAQIGVRESRRIKGEYRLEAADIMQGKRFVDDVAVGSYSIDIHDVAGAGFVQRDVPPYGIPFRCLIPCNVDNLIVAGRSISCSREAQGSLRVTATCMAMGQAAGCAAALAVENKIIPRAIDPHQLRERLLAQGVYLN